MRVAVVGAGSWGTTVAALAARNVDCVLWARDPALAERIDRSHRNDRYLPTVPLPRSIRATASLADACDGADLVAVAVPSHGFRAVLSAAVPHIAPGAAVVSLTKGLEEHSGLRMSEIVRSLLADNPVGVLTGPNLAREVIAGEPAAAVVASEHPSVVDLVRTALAQTNLRVYANPDVIGCEIAAAVKNVLAIAVGTAHGLGFGENTRAALITRGLAELTRLGVALGADPRTFAGLAGVGDLLVTCSSDKSRNHQVGVQLAAGVSLDEILAGMREVAEGVRSCVAVAELARRHEVEMPLVDAVVGVCTGARSVDQSVAELLARTAADELESARP